MSDLIATPLFAHHHGAVLSNQTSSLHDLPPPNNLCLLIITLACAVLGPHATTADEHTDEHIRLTTVIRELNAIDRIAFSGDRGRDSGTSRYYFNNARLREDTHWPRLCASPLSPRTLPRQACL